MPDQVRHDGEGLPASAPPRKSNLLAEARRNRRPRHVSMSGRALIGHRQAQGLDQHFGHRLARHGLASAQEEGAVRPAFAQGPAGRAFEFRRGSFRQIEPDLDLFIGGRIGRIPEAPVERSAVLHLGNRGGQIVQLNSSAPPREPPTASEAVTGVNPVTSVGLGFADPPAGLRALFALLRRLLCSRRRYARALRLTDPGTTASSATGSDASASAAPSPRSAGYARGSRENCCPTSSSV